MSIGDWQLGELAVSVNNTGHGSGGVLSADGELLLEIPLSIGERTLFMIPIRLKVRARMREKF